MNLLRAFEVTPRTHQPVSDLDAFNVGAEALFHLDSVLTLLSMVDGKRIKDSYGGDGHSLAIFLGAIAGICLAFSSEAMTRLDQLELARKSAAGRKQKKGGGDQ